MGRHTRGPSSTRGPDRRERVRYPRDQLTRRGVRSHGTASSALTTTCTGWTGGKTQRVADTRMTNSDSEVHAGVGWDG